MNQMWHGVLATTLGFALFAPGGCTPPGKNLIDARTVVAEKQSLGCLYLLMMARIGRRQAAGGEYHGTSWT